MKKRWMSERSLFEGHSIQLIFKRISWNSGKTADQRPIPWMGGLQRACSRSDLVCKSLNGDSNAIMRLSSLASIWIKLFDRLLRMKMPPVYRLEEVQWKVFIETEELQWLWKRPSVGFLRWFPREINSLRESISWKSPGVSIERCRIRTDY